ncbi:MAG TPA: LarC family nickel insertion protein [Thermoanaerobacterium sp.]|nr:LarC family nickel insertion protein [Thermoanaerobacterium sp.]
MKDDCRYCRTKKKVENIYIVETNIDDMSPEYYQYIFDRLLKNGALDVYITPIFMKKQRPANMLSVLCKEENLENLRKVIFEETSTFGLRQYKVDRYALDRDFKVVRTPFGDVRVKMGYLNGKFLKSHIESDDVKKIAEKTGLSVQAVLNVLRQYDGT